MTSLGGERASMRTHVGLCDAGDACPLGAAEPAAYPEALTILRVVVQVVAWAIECVIQDRVPGVGKDRIRHVTTVRTRRCNQRPTDRS